MRVPLSCGFAVRFFDVMYIIQASFSVSLWSFANCYSKNETLFFFSARFHTVSTKEISLFPF